MTKLLPCPFCGKKPILQMDHRYPGDDCDGVAAFEIICTNIDCVIYRADNTYFLSKDEAIKAWNRRTSNESER